MNRVELLSPVGDFDALVAAVQNGANAVYFGANEFNARMNSKNFDREELKKAIEYAKLRNVKTNLTLNILIKNNEFDSAMSLVKYAYECGIDAIIVQDLGLATQIIKNYPDLDVHSSTQMTIYNLDGVKQIEKLGFKRCVLARELSIEEIKNICKNTNIEIEVFIHGALCICYSGQCLMSSLIGGRSGNRGKCAGTCRLPYTLLRDNKCVDRGYLLSSKDVCTLDILPELINSGVKSFKIEGRMKSPEYVGLVTSIYRKYIDLAYTNKPYVVEDEDREKLLQIFNRGGFSTGYLKGKLGKKMMYKKQPNHLGIYIGDVVNYNKNKGYAKLKLQTKIDLGDSIAIGDSTCKISELMIGNNNIKSGNIGQTVTIGRINGNIKPGDKIYRTVSINLNKQVELINSKENIKRPINCKVTIKENKPITIDLTDIISGVSITTSGAIPDIANTTGLTEERVKEQLSKLGNTVFSIDKFEIDLDSMLITSISNINELRRNAIDLLEEKIKETFARKSSCVDFAISNKSSKPVENPKISLCLNKLNEELNYNNIRDIDRVYIPLRYFINNKFKKTINDITNKFNTYILMPTVSKRNYEIISIDEIIKGFNIKGLVVSNLSQIKKYNGIELIANYTFNIMNSYTTEKIKNLGIQEYTISPESDKATIHNLDYDLKKELIVYGRTRLMTTEYCTIGTYHNCNGLCEGHTFKLKDRLGFEFPIITDRINCNNLIYNSKITSIEWKEFNPDSIRIDILDEDIEGINNIIKTHREGKRFEGMEYTNGNLNKNV